MIQRESIPTLKDGLNMRRRAHIAVQQIRLLPEKFPDAEPAYVETPLFAAVEPREEPT